MGRIFGILAIVVGVWIGAEVMNKGVDQAFGGVFARLGLSDRVSRTEDGRIDGDTVGGRAAKQYRSSFDRGIERVDKALQGE
ncbi:MAG: hypothetical protein V3T14_06495 [Myxococcota bacterium]